MRKISNLFIIYLFTAVCSFLSFTAYSQSFCFSKYQDSTYSSLSNPISLTGSSVWDDTSFYIPIGFPFSFKDKVYDSVTVESNGALFFKNFAKLRTETVTSGNQTRVIVADTLPVIAPFGEIFQGMNLIDRGYYAQSARSQILYKLSGSSPNRVLTVEYKNAGFKSLDSLFKVDSLNVQICLHETSNEITFHFGVGNATDSTVFAGLRGGVTGLGELSTVDREYLPNGYFLSGDPMNPERSYDLSFMTKMPPDRMLYSFIPSPVNAGVSITANRSPVCAQDTLIFQAVVSNAGANPVYQWQVNEILQGSDSSKFYGINLKDNDRVRCIITPAGLCATALPTASNNVTVLKPVLSVSISVNTNPICAGDSVTFTANAVNGGNAVYEWRKNGTAIGANAPVFKDKDFNDKDTVDCIVTSSLPCIVNSTAVSNKIIINHRSVTLPTINIISDKASVCSNDSVKFTASAANAGSNPTYIWKVNGILQGKNSTIFTAKNLSDGAMVTCSLVPDVLCVKDTITSNAITVTVTSLSTATVSIQPDVTPSCAGAPVTFTAAYTNGGTGPAFQWKVNGTNAGINNFKFTTSSLNDNDTVLCIMTSNKACVINPVSTSNKVIARVNPVPVSSLGFDSNQKTEICPGETLPITVISNGAGTNPVYNWYINDVPVNVNSTTFNGQNLNDGDKIYAIMQSSLECKQGRPDSSGILTVRVTTVSKAGIKIQADANPICPAGTIQFTSVLQNEGANPHFNWFLNGTAVGNDASSVSLTGFQDQDKVFCILTSDKRCVTGNPAYSDTIVIGIIDAPVSYISISSDKDTICSGEQVKFQAVVMNPGSNPIYQWKHNGQNVGISSLSYSASNLAQGDSVWCILTTGISCQGAIPVSNKIKPVLRSASGTSVIISSSQPQVCKGGYLAFNAAMTNPGTNPSYQWYLNSNPVGGNSSSYAGQNFNNGDLVKCEVTSGFKCRAVSNTLSVTVNNLLAKVDINPENTEICQGQKVTFSSQATQSPQSYQWFVNETQQTSVLDRLESALLNDQDKVYCVADFGGNCIDTSNVVTITVKASCVSGTSAFLEEAGIIIYPVPAKDHVIIDLPLSGDITIDLIDNSGRVLERKKQEPGASQVRIGLEGRPEGLYFLKFVSEKGMLLRKLIVQ